MVEGMVRLDSIAQYDVMSYLPPNNVHTTFSVHSLDGRYSRITGVMGRADGASLINATMTFIGDGTELESFSLGAQESPRQISVDVTGVRQLRIDVSTRANTGTKVVLAANIE